MDLDTYSNAAQKLSNQNSDGIKVYKTYISVLKFIIKNDWQGACHSSSSILALLLAVQNIESTLCLGEVTDEYIYFDHSWIEIDGAIFDAAVVSTLVNGISYAPVYRNYDLNNSTPTHLKYGVISGEGYDENAMWIKSIAVSEYMGLFPGHENGLFGFAKLIAKSMNLRVSITSLKTTSTKLFWVDRP